MHNLDLSTYALIIFNMLGMLFDTDSEEEEEEESYDLTIARRQLRDKSNPLDLNEIEFRQLFRLSREAFRYVLNTVHLPTGLRNTSIPPILRLAVTLNILGSGSYQINAGSGFLIGMSQPTVSEVFNETLVLLEDTLCRNWIKINTSWFNETQDYFFMKYKIPGVVGCIDGTHVTILKPTQDEHMYFNRKGSHSINTMIICDHKYRILAVNACYGGAAHDSFVWNMSNERIFFEEQYQSGNSSRLLGDSGYGLAPWLLVPYRVANDGSNEETFNTVHSSARSIVERVIGVLKGRWRCCSSDRKLRYTPEKTSRIINVCAALHNICIAHNVDFTDQIAPDDSVPRNPESAELSRHDEAITRSAERIRDSIRDSLVGR